MKKSLTLSAMGLNERTVTALAGFKKRKITFACAKSSATRLPTLSLRVFAIADYIIKKSKIKRSEIAPFFIYDLNNRNELRTTNKLLKLIKAEAIIGFNNIPTKLKTPAASGMPKTL